MNKKQYIEYISIDKLRFDPQNPRLPLPVTLKNDEQVVLQWMLEDATIIDLMLSIGQKGYFPGEPLLVVPENDGSDNYSVIEGNRRLSAVKLLSYPELAPVRKKSVTQVSEEAQNKPTELPVLIFDKREDILDYLGYRHITGIKAWGSLEKARYLKQLSGNLTEGSQQEQYKVLAKAIGSRADYVARILTGLAVYEKIAEDEEGKAYVKGLPKEDIQFSVLTTALGYSNISNFLGMDNDKDVELKNLNEPHLHELATWMFKKNSEGQTRLGESRKLKDLNSVVATPQALDSFRSGTPLTEAVILTQVPREIFIQSVQSAKGRLETARNIVYLVDDVLKSDADLLLEIQKLARFIKISIDDKLIEEELS